MANTYLEVKDIARQGLIRLKNNLVTPALVYRDHSNEFQQKGDSVSVRKPNTFTADEFSTSTNVQNIEEGEVVVKLDKIADVSVEVTSKQLTLNINDFSEQVLNPAMEALAQKIDADLLGLYKDIPYFTGVSGTTPSSLDIFANAGKVLNVNKTPMSQRSAIFDPSATARFQVIPSLINAEKAGTTEALRTGSIGNIFGLGNYMDQNIKTHVAGGYTALTDVTVSATALATTITMESAGGVSTAVLKQGDVFTLDGNQYVVTADSAAAVAGDIASVAIYPALKATVSSGAVTFADQSAGGHVSNLAFHRNAFALVNRPMALPVGGAQGYVVSYDGLSIRVTQGYSMSGKVNEMSFDILYGLKTLQPELATRILG